jgi:hypothetical protein
MENYIKDFSYENCFWDNRDSLYNHLSSKYKEYLSIGELNESIADNIDKFCKSLLLSKNKYKPYKENDTSSRGKAIQMTLNFINKIVDNLKKFAENLIIIANKIYEKECSYDSKKLAKKMCDESLKKYENSLRTLIVKKNTYYESVNQVIEHFLNNKYKNNNKEKEKNNKNSIDAKKDNLKKKRKDYKEQLIKTENYRTEYIELQRNIFSSEEEFERDCTNELRRYFKKIISFYNDLLKNSSVDKEITDILEKINGTRDNQIFAANNRTIMSCPSRIEFVEYNQDVDAYSNLEVIKNQIKNKTKEESKTIKFQIALEVKKFLKELLEDSPNDNNSKLEEIVESMLNSNISEENYNSLVKLFQDSYDDYKIWEKENVGILDFKKVGEKWDTRFRNMQLFLDAFNKARLHNKELNKHNFDYFNKALDKILSFNDNEDIDYKLCELLITLSSTFYYKEKQDEKEIKKYASEVIRNTSPIIQKASFWVGLTKYELNEEIMKEKNKEQNSNNTNNLHKINSLINNLNTKIPILNKKKNKENKESQNVINKNIVAKIMSIGYNLVQFIIESDTLNETMANIFRNFKISKDNKELIIDMVNAHIESEKIKNLKIDKEMLMNCDNIEYFFNYKEIKKEKEINNKDIINYNKIEENKNNDIVDKEKNDFQNNIENNNNINNNKLENDKYKDNSMNNNKEENIDNFNIIKDINNSSDD